MKKKNKNIFSSINNFIDKILITPITKIFMSIVDFIKDNGKGIEKFINNKQTLIIVSLIFSFSIFFILDRNSDILLNKSAEILYNQPVVAEYNEEAYVIEGLPKTVDITLIGRKSDLYLAKQYPTKNVSVDLRGLAPGSHKVSLKYNQGLSSIEYKIDPSTATIVVYEKVSETRELDYDILHKDKLNSKLFLEKVELSRNDVVIKGAEYKLAQVATVKALIDVENITSQKVGVITLKNIPLMAYNTKGEKVDVEIVPASINANITISSPSKEVPVKVIPKGDLSFGKSISNIEISQNTATVYGEQKILDELNSLDVEIDVNNLDKNKTFNININKPSGIRDISIKTLTVKVTLDDVTTKEIPNIQISSNNLSKGLIVQASSEADSKVTVIVKGSKSVIDSLDLSTIKASIDLSGYTIGEYEVPVTVSGSDLKVSYETKTTKVKIKIINS